MAKQEEIREGVAKRIWDWWRRNSNDLPQVEWCDVTGGYRGIVLAITDICLEYEGDWGVVLRVDRELPENPFIGDEDFHDRTGDVERRTALREGYDLARQDMIRAGYVAVESLIEA